MATRHQFLPCDVSLTDSLIDWQHLQGHRQLTDTYLLALAVENQAVLVSFDSRMNYRIIKTAKPSDLIMFD